MGPSGLDTLSVERLHGYPAHIFLLKARQCDESGLLPVADCVPALFHDLTALLVAHQGELAFDLGGCLTFVDSVGADPLDLHASV